jgi:hypothetical protein
MTHWQQTQFRMDAIANELNWRANVDRPTFARVKYLVIMELTITSLFAQVFVMRHHMSCCRFPSFPTGSLLAFWNPKKPPAALLLPTNGPVQYQSNSIITIISWEQPEYYRFLICDQGTFCVRPRGIILVKSTQIRWFSRWSGGEGWSSRAVAQRAEAKSLKTRVKGTD